MAADPEVVVVVAATIADAEFLLAAMDANVRGAVTAVEAAALERFLLIVTGVQS